MCSVSKPALRALDRIVLRMVERASRLGEGLTVSDIYFEIAERHPHVTYWDVCESVERLIRRGDVRIGEPPAKTVELGGEKHGREVG